MVTTDAAAAGKREADERVRADEGLSNPMHTHKAKNDKKGGGYSTRRQNIIAQSLTQPTGTAG